MYNREKAIEYAHKWAYARNPRYMDFSLMGGDCTNFVSQCLLAGGAPQNWKPVYGWYYDNPNQRAPAWTGVEFLYRFLTRKAESIGPYANVVPIGEIKAGDIIQLSFLEGVYAHSLFVVKAAENATADDIFVATHTEDHDNRVLSSYSFLTMRCLSIQVRRG